MRGHLELLVVVMIYIMNRHIWIKVGILAMILIGFSLTFGIYLKQPNDSAAIADSDRRHADDFDQQLSEAVRQLNILQVKFKELQAKEVKTEEITPLSSIRTNQQCNSEPSENYEMKRRQVYKGVEEMWYFVQHELVELRKDAGSTERANHIQDILSSAEEHHRYKQNRINHFSAD